MKDAILEVDAMGKDEAITYKFEEGSNLGINKPNFDANTFVYTIVYNGLENKAHETKHGYQALLLLKGGKEMQQKYHDDKDAPYTRENESYKRQYFTDPKSMPIELNNFKDIDNKNCYQQIKNSDGTPAYPLIK